MYRTSECYNSIQTKTIKPKNFPIHCICAHTTTISTNKPTHMYSASTMMLLVDFSYQQESYKFTHIHPLLYSWWTFYFACLPACLPDFPMCMYAKTKMASQLNVERSDIFGHTQSFAVRSIVSCMYGSSLWFIHLYVCWNACECVRVYVINADSMGARVLFQFCCLIEFAILLGVATLEK